jgi:hypothetical protein
LLVYVFTTFPHKLWHRWRWLSWCYFFGQVEDGYVVYIGLRQIHERWLYSLTTWPCI